MMAGLPSIVSGQVCGPDHGTLLLEDLERKPGWLLKVVPTEETTSRPTSQLRTLSGTGIGRKFSPSPCVSCSWNLLLPSSPAPFQRFLLQLDLPFIQVFLSSLRAAAGVSSHHFLLEFFLEFWFLGVKLGTPLKNSHASFLVRKRCFSSTRVLQSSRSRSNSTGLLFTSCCLIEASSLPAA